MMQVSPLARSFCSITLIAHKNELDFLRLIAQINHILSESKCVWLLTS